ncbi:hypothetical protein FA95DRAFT_1488449 [Auriscalpium vulgare]|uniref:Uncharacterized protein n=1 Tax=Auriscalpium vulgare TaxID=40419 RepID=A0ACB8S094_9AGAM|nr:hypothetical protein FA95DRAFT_1488449 [Auriscalpium vulgare]
MPTIVNAFPSELLFLICAQVYAAGLPPRAQSLDPHFLQEAGIPVALPSSFPPPSWPEPIARKTLASLTLVNRAWGEAAKPWLWRKVEVRLPRSWLALVDEIAGGEDEEGFVEQTALAVDQSIREVAHAALALKAGPGNALDSEAALKMKESLMQSLSGPDGSIPPELLTPPVSRDPSPRRLRQKSKSPARWKLMRSISNAVQDLMGRDEHGMYGAYDADYSLQQVTDQLSRAVPAVHDSRPGRYVNHLDFNHFRTIGMRRSVEEGVSSRFVTGERLEAVLKETPNLVAFGATEYMDGALTLPVLKELLLRGVPSRGRDQPARGRGLVVEDTNDIEAEDNARRRECKELEALDFTGCVSIVFVNAFTEFVNLHLRPGDWESNDNDRRDRRRRSRSPDTHVSFPGLQRLSLRGAMSISSQTLNAFVLAFPSLTHIDLSCTRASPDLLERLASSSTVQLKSLSLARCTRLTGASIRDFLVSAPAATGITELNLYGDGTFPCPLSADELRDVLTSAPCFASGALRYLDLSSAELDATLLAAIPPQPHLRSLGLAYIPTLPLHAVADFVREKAPHVEVLALQGTSPELGYGPAGASAREANIALHTHFIRPLCTPPFSFSISGPAEARPAPTRVRLIELASALLTALGGGAGSWRIVRSKGGRGWYVDTASGWVVPPGADGPVLRRDLTREHPWRDALEKLADANGNVSSGIGWHARKMEVLHGHGMLGREDGLYGAVSFAYQG